MVLGGSVLVFATMLAVLLAVHQDVGFLAVVALATVAGMCAWTVHLHRRVEQVARVNREQ